MTTFSLPIKKVVTENTRVKSFYFDYRLEAAPGQYLMIDVPGHGQRPFGAVVVNDQQFLISIAAVGAGTTALHDMHEGDTLTITGPLGTSFQLPPAGESMSLVAGGYGIAPLAFLARVGAEAGHHVDLFAGAKTETEFMFYPFLQHPNITLIKTTDDGSAGIKGFVTDAFTQSLPEKVPGCVYIVGPPPMAEKVIAPCLEQGIPFQISMEAYANEPFGPVIDDILYRKLQARTSQ